MKKDSSVKDWLRERGITEVEIFIADLTGMLRGKIVPCEKFLLDAVRMPESALAQTITGEWEEQEEFLDEMDGDMELRPDIEGCFIVPWAREPTGQIICDAVSNSGSLIRWAPRSVLKRVLRLFHRQGWQPQVAPELEFYLASRDNNPDNPLTPPVGRTGRPEFSKQAFSIDAVNEFEPVIEDIYRFAEAKNLAVDTLTHEEGVAQFEINFKHDDALTMADQVLMFKRCVREAAIRHNMMATFMAKPMQEQPGSSMHLHQSLLSRATRENVFAGKAADGKGSWQRSKLFEHYLGGLQQYAGEMLAMYVPNVNSFRRLNHRWPTVNNHWGINNRTVGFRLPDASNAAAVRVENRISGADANPYLAIAASLLSGYLGMKHKIAPRSMVTEAAWELPRGIPLSLQDALEQMTHSKTLRESLGNQFVDVYAACKKVELTNYQYVVSSWERRFLLDI